MKKTILIVLTALTSAAFAQSSIQVKCAELQNTVISPNSVIYGFATVPEGNVKINFDVKNTSNATKTYIVKRYDATLNNQAEAYFCFAGQCYGASTYSSPYSLTLTAGQSASEIPGSFNIITTDLDEYSNTIGISYVKYSVINVNNTSDSLQFTIAYNVSSPVGVKETSKVFSSLEIFPNPAKEIATISISSARAFESTVSVYNALGEVVYSKPVSVSEGKNKVEINVEQLPSGVYFATLKNGNSSISKRLIVN